jgi:coenzyme F420-0:L-glutamate ligase/coenzyme F420-1:gamma-L-glutamate ligase
MVIQIIPLDGLPIIQEGDRLSQLICAAATKQKTPVQNGDVVVITHVVVSRAEGRTVNLETIRPSRFAKTVAERTGKDPALVEVVLREADQIIRMRDGNLITLTRHGFICANSGVDQSNVPGERVVALLPKDPEQSARQIRRQIEEFTGKTVAVIVSDTHGRPLRNGEINIAIGVAGMKAVLDRKGQNDLFGYVLRVKQTAVADELASAAELVIGQANEGIPVALIRGYRFQRSEASNADSLTRPLEKELFV